MLVFESIANAPHLHLHIKLTVSLSHIFEVCYLQFSDGDGGPSDKPGGGYTVSIFSESGDCVSPGHCYTINVKARKVNNDFCLWASLTAHTCTSSLECLHGDQ